MGMTAFEIFGVLKLDKKGFDSGLKSAEKSAKSALSGFASGAGRGLGGIGKAMGGAVVGAAKVAATAITAATGAATAFAGSAVKAGSAFDQAMGSVAATMGKEVDDLNAEVGSVDTSFGHFEGTLRDFAKFMGTNTTFSATQAAEALNYMALAGYKTQDSMEMLPAVLDMAAAGAMDLARASDMITDTQSALGLSFERTHQMVNEFAKAASSGNTSVEQLGEAFLRVGGLAKNLNGGFVTLSDGTVAAVDGVQEMEIALTAMANAGVKGAEAGTHMRNMLLKLSSPTKKGKEAIAQYTQGIFDAEGNMRSLSDIFGDLRTSFAGITQAEKLSAISDLFNARDIASAESLLAAVEGTYVRIGDEVLSLGSAQEKYGDAIYDTSQGFEIVQSSWDSLGESILSAGDAASEMSKTKLDNLIGDVTLFKSALESAQIEINDKLSPYMREFVQLGTTGLQDVTKGFTEGGLTGAMEALGPFLSGLTQKVVEVLPTLIEAGTELLGALGQGLIDNADLIWDAIVQVGGMLKDKFKETLLGVARDITAADGTELGDSIAEFISNAFSDVGDFVKIGVVIIGQLIRVIGEAAPEIIPAIVEVMDEIGQALFDDKDHILSPISDIISSIFDSIDMGEVISKASDFMLNMMHEAFLAIYNLDGSEIGSNIAEFLQTVFADSGRFITAGFQIISSLAKVIGDSLPELIPTVVEILLNIVQYLVENIDILVDGALQLITGLAEGLIAALPILVQKVPEITISIIDALIENLPLILATGARIVGELVAGILGAIPDLVVGLTKFWLKLRELILGWFPKIVTMGGQLIDNFIAGFIDNISAVETGVQKVVTSVTEAIQDMIDGALQWGKDLIDNFVNGITDFAGKVGDGIAGVAQDVADFIGFSEPEKGPLSDFHKFAPDMIDLFTQGMEDNMDKVEDAANDMALAIKPDMSDVDAIEVRTAEIPEKAKGGLSDKLVSEIEKLIESFNAQQETVIPIYIGNKMIDELVLDANRRIKVKSGGFASV